MHLWRAEFKSSYLEEICRKTGQPLSFSEFNQTLRQALEASSAQVFVDLLNLQDLQMLKGQRPSADNSQADDHLQKRYLILTTLENEKKFHVPLPLSPVDISETKTLDKETVKFVIKNVADQRRSLHETSSSHRTAQSFFSAQNPHNPQVAENRKLK
jgi:hypothetical protein